MSVPVYLYECHEWSDGEEHPDEDHNSAYDFEYFVLEQPSFGGAIVCCLSGIVMQFYQHDIKIKKDKYTRDLPMTEAIRCLKKYLRSNDRAYCKGEFVDLVKSKIKEMKEMQTKMIEA